LGVSVPCGRAELYVIVNESRTRGSSAACACRTSCAAIASSICACCSVLTCCSAVVIAEASDNGCVCGCCDCDEGGGAGGGVALGGCCAKAAPAIAKPIETTAPLPRNF